MLYAGSMVQTQVELPDALYADVQRLAKEKEISFTEIVRLGLEHLLKNLPPNSKNEPWKLAPPIDTSLLSDPFENPDWRYEVNQSTAAAEIIQQAKERKLKT